VSSDAKDQLRTIKVDSFAPVNIQSPSTCSLCSGVSCSAAAFFLLPNAGKSISSICLLYFNIYVVCRCTLLRYVRARRNHWQIHHCRCMLNKSFCQKEDTKWYEIVFNTIRFPSKHSTTGTDCLSLDAKLKRTHSNVYRTSCLSFCLSTFLTIVVSSVDCDNT
jgi:hypothetical protein